MSAKVKSILVSMFMTAVTAGIVVPASISQAPSAVAAESTGLKEAAALVGKPAPDFLLPDSNGKNVSLGDYKGHFVVLEWINYDCPFVQKHYASGNMQHLQEKYTAKGVVWLNINSSAAGRPGNYPPAKINELQKEHKAHSTAYLMDESGKVGRMYGARSTPAMYVIDKAGNVVYAGAIDDKASTDEADIKNAKNYVEEALDAAMAGKPVAIAWTKSYGCSVKY